MNRPAWLSLIMLLTACPGLTEVRFAEATEESFGLGFQIYGASRSDLWTTVNLRGAAGYDPANYHLQHFDGSRTVAVALPPVFDTVPGRSPQAMAAGQLGGLWLSSQSATSKGTVILVSVSADGSSVDHSSAFPPLTGTDTYVNPSLASSKDAVVAAWNILSGRPVVVRFSGADQQVLPVPQAPYGTLMVVAVNGADIYATASKQGAPQVYLRFNGTDWAEVDFGADPGPLHFSFFGPTDGWAFSWNAPQSHDYVVHHFDGAWSTQKIFVDNSGRALDVLATGPGQFALLAQLPNQLIFRTGTTTGLTEGNHALTPANDKCPDNCEAVLKLVRQTNDGAFVMASGFGLNPPAPTRFFTGKATDLH